MTELERVAQAIADAVGDEQLSCNSDTCWCWSGAAIMQCKLGVTVEQLAEAAIAAMDTPAQSGEDTGSIA